MFCFSGIDPHIGVSFSGMPQGLTLEMDAEVEVSVLAYYERSPFAGILGFVGIPLVVTHGTDGLPQAGAGVVDLLTRDRAVGIAQPEVQALTQLDSYTTVLSAHAEYDVPHTSSSGI